jgi:methyl-accepting chemotaxis protein
VHKLILLILVAFLGITTISVLGIYQLKNTNGDLLSVMDNTLPSFNLLHTIDKRFLDSRIAMRAHVMAIDSNKKQTLETRFHTDMDTAQEQLKQYEKLISDENDRANYQKIRAAVEQYINDSEATLSFSRENKTAEAIVNIEKLSSVANEASSAIDESVKYNETLAKNLSVKDQHNFDSAELILLMSTISMTAFLALIGWFIYRQLSSGLSSAHTTISRIENTLDFTLRADVQGNDEISQMLQAFNQLIGHMQNSLRHILVGVDKVAESASQLQNSAHRVSEGSSAQNASTSHMAASVEEMTVSINHVADQAKMTSDQSNEMGRKAETGQNVIGHTVENIHTIATAVDNAAQDIKQLEEKGREIESVISIIKAVAEQTNLLALNAAIEAARAGEQGRGFAVVADEVRNLAARTATSTKEISDIIKAIQNVSSSAVKRMQEAISKVEQGVSGAGEANDTMEEICRVASESVSLVADISHAIREQGAATNSIAQQVECVAQMVDENTQAANETALLASDLAQVSDDMKQVVASYRL